MRVKLPYKPRGEMFAVVKDMAGGSRASVFCEDGKVRMGRIIGKMKKRVWIRPNDLLVITPWSVQSDKKCDIIYRYTVTEKERLVKKKFIPEVLSI
jgi:translation initiation factor 1A